MKWRVSLWVFFVTICILFAQNRIVSAQSTGIIDPESINAYTATFVHTTGVHDTALQINFGKFDARPEYNITISDDGLRGFAWSEVAGWIVLNCEDTVDGCSEANQQFHVAVAPDGTLSGFAWGETTGWINFGPFDGTNAAQVQISNEGVFKGVEGDAGYAWSQNFGWIVFDCTSGTSCVKTNYIPSLYRRSSVTTGGYVPHGDTVPVPQEYPSPSTPVTAPLPPASQTTDPDVPRSLPQASSDKMREPVRHFVPLQPGSTVVYPLPPLITEQPQHIFGTQGAEKVKKIFSTIGKTIQKAVEKIDVAFDKVAHGLILIGQEIRSLGIRIYTFFDKLVGRTHDSLTSTVLTYESPEQTAFHGEESQLRSFAKNYGIFIAVVILSSIQLFRKKP